MLFMEQHASKPWSSWKSMVTPPASFFCRYFFESTAPNQYNSHTCTNPWYHLFMCLLSELLHAEKLLTFKNSGRLITHWTSIYTWPGPIAVCLASHKLHMQNMHCLAQKISPAQLFRYKWFNTKWQNLDGGHWPTRSTWRSAEFKHDDFSWWDCMQGGGPFHIYDTDMEGLFRWAPSLVEIFMPAVFVSAAFQRSPCRSTPIPGIFAFADLSWCLGLFSGTTLHYSRNAYHLNC